MVPRCPACQFVFLYTISDQVGLKLQNNFPTNCREVKSPTTRRELKMTSAQFGQKLILVVIVYDFVQ